MTRASIYRAVLAGQRAAMIAQIDARQFEQQIQTSDVPLLVEFFSDHCSHCQQLLPILGEVAAERSSSLRVFKFNAGEDPLFASKFRISAVPNLILFENGTPKGQRAGFINKRELLGWIDSTTK